MKIRHKSESDREELKNFYLNLEKSLPKKISERKGGVDRLVERVINEDGLIVAEKGGKIIGALAYVKNDENLVINMTGVSDEYRGSMVLGKMAKHLYETEGKNVGYIKTVAQKNNEKSINNLEKLGFEKIGVRPHTFDKRFKEFIYGAPAEKILKKFPYLSS